MPRRDTTVCSLACDSSPRTLLMIRPAATALLSMLVVLVIAGCGEMPAAAAKKPVKKKAARPAAATRPAPTPPKVAADAYASVDAAMAEVEGVVGSDASEANEKLLKVETWLNMQGAKIAPELEAKIKDPAVGLATRLTACRVLTRQGAAA